MKLNVRNSSLLLCGLLAIGLAGSAVAQDGDVQTHGVTTVGEKAISRTTAEIMNNPVPISPDQFLNRILKSTEDEVDRDGLPCDPGSPQVNQWPPVNNLSNGSRDGGGIHDGHRYSPQTIGTQWTAETYGNVTPPDSSGAVGPTQVLVTTNHNIRVYSKTGVLGALNTTQDSFFNSVRNGSGTSDPRATFDRLTNRWFVICINVSTPNRTLIAVSDGPTISGATVWKFFFTTAPSNTFDDYCSLGVDANGVYIGYNIFVPNSYGGTAGIVIQKSSILASGPIVSTRFSLATASGEGPYSPRGVDNDDPAPANGYFVGGSNIAFGRVVVRKVTGAGTGSPTLGSNLTVTVPSTANPISSVATNGISIDQIDDRVYHAQIRLNRKDNTRYLWMAHHIRGTSGGVGSGSGDRNIARWYQLTVSGTPTLIKAGTAYDSSVADNYSFPSVAMTGQGHMAMGFTMARSGQFIRIGAAGRLNGDVGFPGDTQPTTLAFTSPSPYSNFANRWGDYSITDVDPADDQTVWTIQDSSAGSSWAVRVVQLVAPPPSQVNTVSPNALNQGTNYNVVVTGTASAGSEYYDTDAGYPKRLQASVSGTGVTVNSITFSHSAVQTMTLNITVSAGATLGNRNLTITNPDGQSVTKNNAITIQANNPPVTLAPVSTTIGLGAIASGDNASLAADDSNPLKICKAFIPNQTSPRVRFDSDFVSPYLNPTAVSLALKARMTTGGSFSVRAFIADRTGGGFTYGAPNQVVPDSVINLTFANYNGNSTAPGSNVFTDGTMRTRVEIVQTGFSAVAVPCSEFELLNLTVTP